MSWASVRRPRVTGGMSDEQHCGGVGGTARPVTAQPPRLADILLISLGACFELYDLFLTAYIVPGCNAWPVQRCVARPVLAAEGDQLAGAGTFVFALFAGLFVGTIIFGWVPTLTGGGRSSPSHCYGTVSAR